MNKEFIQAIEDLEKERHISKDILIEAIESALVSAYKKNYGTSQNVRVDINQETGALLLGDVVISMETAVKQAKTYGHSLEREVGFLTVHSMLHLLGYDHETSALDAAKMREKEEAILGELGISRDESFTPDES